MDDPETRLPATAVPLVTANGGRGGPGLRRRILDAAALLLADSSSAQAVTLRGIARQAGIAAPSIYPYFADRDAVLDAVVSETFTALAAALGQAAAPQVPAADRVRALCRAYIDFAAGASGLYRVLFERIGPNTSAGAPTYPEGLLAFGLLTSALTDAVTEGTSTSTDPAGDSAALWMALHGLATLPPATPGFPWATTARLLEQLTTGLAHLDAADRPRAGVSG